LADNLVEADLWRFGRMRSDLSGLSQPLDSLAKDGFMTFNTGFSAAC